MSKTRIYADHAATTALSPRAFEAMRPYLSAAYGNPSTLYSLAREPRKAIAYARETIAAAIGADPEEVFFTACGTESDNWALKGIAFADGGKPKHIVTSAIEHHAVLNACAFLERLGHRVTYLPVDGKGIVSPEAARRVLEEGADLLSVMLANNEIGTIEPIAELAEEAHAHGCLMHTDAVQAMGHIPVNVEALGVDMLSASAHKFNGPKGTGFLYIRKGTRIEPLIHGGGQEQGMRAGTENVAGIVGMAEALREHLEKLEEETARLMMLRSRLTESLRAAGVDFIENGAEERIPGSASLSFCNAEGEMLLHRLDLMGAAVATGSACNSKETVLSHVIRAIGVPEAYARGTVRITLGMDNDEEQIDTLVTKLRRILGESMI